MKFKDPLIQYVYENMPLEKSSISSEKRQEIIEAFCIRNNCKCLESNTGGMDWVVVDALETLELHQDWQYSFKDLGYEAPLLQGN